MWKEFWSHKFFINLLPSTEFFSRTIISTYLKILNQTDPSHSKRDLTCLPSAAPLRNTELYAESGDQVKIAGTNWGNGNYVDNLCVSWVSDFISPMSGLSFKAHCNMSLKALQNKKIYWFKFRSHQLLLLSLLLALWLLASYITSLSHSFFICKKEIRSTQRDIVSQIMEFYLETYNAATNTPERKACVSSTTAKKGRASVWRKIRRSLCTVFCAPFYSDSPLLLAPVGTKQTVWTSKGAPYEPGWRGQSPSLLMSLIHCLTSRGRNKANLES